MIIIIIESELNPASGSFPTTAHGPRQFRIRRAAAAQPGAAPARESRSPGPPRPSVPGPGDGGPRAVSHWHGLNVTGPAVSDSESG